jgi:hypothetical protein
MLLLLMMMMMTVVMIVNDMMATTTTTMVVLTMILMMLADEHGAAVPGADPGADQERVGLANPHGLRGLVVRGCHLYPTTRP